LSRASLRDALQPALLATLFYRPGTYRRCASGV